MADAKSDKPSKPASGKAKPLRTPGKDWRSKPDSGASTAAAAAAPAEGGEAGAGGDEKRYKFRNEEKPRGDACYVCSKDGHRAEDCEIVAGLQKRFNVFIQKQKNNEALTLKEHNALLWDCARAMEKRGAVYVFDSISAQVFPKLKPNDDSFKALEFIHQKAAKDKSFVDGLPIPSESATLRIKALVAARGFVSAQQTALTHVSDVVAYIKSHAGECARAKNRFKLRTILHKATKLPAAQVGDVISLLARGGVISEKKTPKSDAKSKNDGKAADGAATAAADGADGKKAEKAPRATDVFVFDFTKVNGLKDLPAEAAKKTAAATSATTGAGRGKKGGLTASQLKKQKIAAKKAKFEAEAIADPAKAAARKAAADAKREQRKEQRAKQRATDAGAANKSKQLAGTALPKKKRKADAPPAAATPAAASTDSAAASADANSAATPSPAKKRKTKSKSKADGAASSATAAADD